MAIADRPRDRARLPAAALCRLADIADPGGKGFCIDGERRIFVVRRGGRAFGYRNVCPHRGTPLDWKPDTFLARDKRLIQCATHGARFEIETGICVAGPCPGRALEPVALRLEDGVVMLDE